MKQKIILLFVLLLLFTGKSFSQCNPGAAFDHLDINQVDARINSGGDLWWDHNNNSGYIVPKDSGITSMFAGALWIGGLDNLGNLHLAAQTYRQQGVDFFPGPLDPNGNVTQNNCNDYDKVWKVYKSDIDNLIALHLAGASITPQNTSQSIFEWPAIGNPNAVGANGVALSIANDLAPFVDVDNDGIYNASNGDYPDVPGDECLFWVYNDNGNVHGESGGDPLKVEIRAMAFAYANVTSCMEYTTFYKYNIINKSGVNYDSVYLGKWCDVDLGDYSDDFVGCDTSRDLGICYNGDAVDGPGSPSYGSTPPIIAVDLLENSAMPSGNLMTSFTYYNNDVANPHTGDPTMVIHYYNYLRGMWKDGTPLTFGGNGYGGSIPFPFMFPDNPADSTGWSECSEQNIPMDRRFLVGSGPFDFAANQNITFAYAVEWVRPPLGAYPCPSFDNITGCADYIQSFYDNVVATGVNAVAPSSQVLLSPNPFSNYCTMDLSQFRNDKDLSLQIFSLQGQLVRNYNLVNDSKLKIERNNLSSGLYFYKLISAGKVLALGKMMAE